MQAGEILSRNHIQGTFMDEEQHLPGYLNREQVARRFGVSYWQFIRKIHPSLKSYQQGGRYRPHLNAEKDIENLLAERE